MSTRFPPYPMLLAPDFKEKVWGGRHLKSWFEDMPEEPAPIGEAWVLSAHPCGPTTVINGPLAGRTLAELYDDFPLLIKVLSSQEDLSVQVHPSDDYPHLEAGESGKSEVWLVLDAAPGASIIYGLAEDVTPDLLKLSLERAQEPLPAARTATAPTQAANRTAAPENAARPVMDCFRRVQVAAGDLVPVPPGTVHALGAGLIVAEVQQSSDTTYRLWDYGRPGTDGKPRTLHTHKALDIVSYSPPPAIIRPCASGFRANTPQLVYSFAGFDVWLCACSGRWDRTAPALQAQSPLQSQSPRLSSQPPLTSPGPFRAILALSGRGSVQWTDDQGRDERIALRPGSSLLIPASCPDYTLKSHQSELTLLEVTPA